MLHIFDASRRKFLAASSSLVLGAALGTAGTALGAEKSPAAGAKPAKKLRLAAINSIFRLRSHAYHIIGRFVHGYEVDGFPHRGPFEVVRMYNDQSPPDDLGSSFCQRHGIELCRTPEQALGGERLDVDGVLLVVEHGDYPLNEFNQVLYPRYELFQKVVEVFRASGRSVPVFVDKHLSYDHRQAAKMVQAARELKFGLMAGSSLPVTWRMPEIEPPLGTPFREAVVTFGFDRGAPEIYLFHALETLQCMLERRPGSESGVRAVECLEGDAVWKAGDAGRFSWKLVDAALARSPSENVGPLRENVLHPLAILIEYNDGTRGAVLNLIEQTSDFAFAGQIAGREQPVASCFYLPPPPAAKFFNPLVFNIEKFLQTGQPTYPVERTLLTSTVLDLALHSLKDGGRKVVSPALDIHYQAPQSSGFFRGPFVRNP